MKKWIQRHPKTSISFGVILLLLVAARLALPSFAKRELNDHLAELDGPFCGHIDDLRISLLRGSYTSENLRLFRRSTDRKSCDDPVLQVRELETGISWGQLIRGRLRIELDARTPTIFADALIAALKTNTKEDNIHGAKQAADVLIPWSIESARLSEGSIHFELLGDKPSAVTLEHAEGVVAGVEEGRQNARPVFFRLKGNVFKSARLLLTGKVDLAGQPAMWKVNYTTERLHLPEANPLLIDRVPITFTQGNMDLYGEAAGGGPLLTGYAKLLFDHIQVVSKKEHWKNLKQGFVEIFGSLFFIVAKNHDLQTAGTMINFGNKDGKFSVDVAGAVSSALKHRSGEKILHPGIENRVALPKRTRLGAEAKAAQTGENL
jgi:hypothetical protein